ncbi:MAG TPA: hypothetical protein VM407_08885 [Acidovorax sp.]|nr:hypothetical protein [Acidovorax sp.]
MIGAPEHLLLEVFEGYAELAIPARDLVSERVPIRFHPKTLRLEAFFPPASEVVGVLGPERESILLLLRNVVLSEPTNMVQLRAEELQLYRSNALSEWPESLGLTWSDNDGEGEDLRRLELAPQHQALAFQASQTISIEHPFQIYYGNACPSLRSPTTLEHHSLPETISFCSDFPQPGLLCAFSSDDFFAKEERIHAGWMLIHGRQLPPALQIRGREVCFFGVKDMGEPSYLPLVDDWGSALPDSIMKSLMDMEHTRFASTYLALKYFLAGKQADLWLEARYMLLMTCVEAMDGAFKLKEAKTASMLGISSDSALLFNCMRNKLVHGCGGYRQAFDAFLQQDLKQRSLPVELADCVRGDSDLDFGRLWLRLCERLDAFWCAYLGIPDELTRHRYSPIPLMGAVDKNSLP